MVAHPDHVDKFIGPETQVVGTYEMDPLGMGPVTMTFTYGSKQTSYDEFYNHTCTRKLMRQRKKTEVMPKSLLVHLELGNIIMIQRKFKNMDCMQY